MSLQSKVDPKLKFEEKMEVQELLQARKPNAWKNTLIPGTGSNSNFSNHSSKIPGRLQPLLRPS